jgi:lipid II:glycine glycyltransferase (peptidoglycan interpeptide bridge formation enzyme)
MRLEIVNQSESNRWNEIIFSSSNGTLYHTWEWLKILEKHSKSKLFPIIYFDSEDDTPFAAIPLFYMNKFGIKMVFSPPPGSAITLGPVLNNKGYSQHKLELIYSDFQSTIDKFIKQLSSIYTFIVTSPGLFDIRPFSWAKYKVTPVYSYKIDLSQGEETIWKHMSDRLKKNIRKAQKNGIKFMESSSMDGINYIYNSLNRRYTEQHLNLPLKQSYLQDLFRKFGGSSIRVYLAMHDENIVGASMYSMYKDKIVAHIGGARNESIDLEAIEFIRWNAITRAIRDGYKWFELFGANTRQLCDAKSQFCPILDIYFEMKRSGLVGSFAERAYLRMKKKIL